MSEYTATVKWQLGDNEFSGNSYSRAHEWSFDGGLTVPASASPDIVPFPLSVAENVDPEEAFVASLASCHMLFFLDLAEKRGLKVAEYTDEAIGYLEKNSEGRVSVSRVTLRPKAQYIGDSTPDRSVVEEIHHRAHELCFIANSVKTQIDTDIVS